MSATLTYWGHKPDIAEIRRYWKADRPFDAMQDDFARLSALVMLSEIDRLLTEQDALREAMVHVLEWPLPDGTVETWALPKWLAQEARAALPTPKQQEEKV